MSCFEALRNAGQIFTKPHNKAVNDRPNTFGLALPWQVKSCSLDPAMSLGIRPAMAGPLDILGENYKNTDPIFQQCSIETERQLFTALFIEKACFFSRSTYGTQRFVPC